MVGMSLAAALGGAGLRVVLVDRADPAGFRAPDHDARASAIALGSRRVLEGIGVWPAMAASAEPILDIRVTDGASLLFLHYDHRETGDQPMGHIVPNQATRVALLDRLAACPGVSHLAPASVGAVSRAGAVATLDLADGRTVRARLLVAADGRRSWMRGQAGIPVTEWSYGQTGIVCTMTHERPHRGIAHERFLRSGPLAFLPMTDDALGRHRSSVVWTERADLAPKMMALDEADFARELARRFGPSHGAMALAGSRQAWPLGLLFAARYRDRRLALVGDAAHAIHPISGQGLNLGLRDVAALAEAVVDAVRLGMDPGDPSVLARYERWRRFDGFVLAATTDSLNRLFSNDIAPIRLARDLGLGAVNRLPPLKRLFMRHAMGTLGRLPRLVDGAPL